MADAALLGETVLYRDDQAVDHPAIVTRVNQGGGCNLMIFFDGAAPSFRLDIREASNQETPEAETWRTRD